MSMDTPRDALAPMQTAQTSTWLMARVSYHVSYQ